MTSPDSGASGTADLPDYAPIPRSALGPALNDQRYYVGRVERNEQASRELPVGVRREVADTTDPAAAKGLIDRVDGEVGPGRAG